MKLNKIIVEEKEKKEEKCPVAQALEQSEISKEAMEDVMKERTVEEHPVSDIDETIKASEIDVPKKNKFNVVESYLKENNVNYLSNGTTFRIKTSTRATLGTIVEFFKANKVSHSIQRIKDENFRYAITVYNGRALKEGKELKEVVSDEAYDIADVIITKIGDKKSISMEEFDSMFDEAVKEVFSDTEKEEIGDLNDLKTDVRGILSYHGFATEFEGSNEGGLTATEGISADRADVYARFKDALVNVKKAMAEWSEVFEIDDFAYDTANELFSTLGLGDYFSMSLDEYEPFLDDCINKIEDMISEENAIDYDEEHRELGEETGKFFVYLSSPTGTELIGSGTKEECEKIKAEKDKEWQPGYMWSTEITDKEQKEVNLYDSLEEGKGIKHNPEEKKVFALEDLSDKEIDKKVKQREKYLKHLHQQEDIKRIENEHEENKEEVNELFDKQLVGDISVNVDGGTGNDVSVLSSPKLPIGEEAEESSKISSELDKVISDDYITCKTNDFNERGNLSNEKRKELIDFETECGNSINPKGLTYRGLLKLLVDNKGEDFDYNDSAVREFAFSKLSEITGFDYDCFYDAWLNHNNGCEKLAKALKDINILVECNTDINKETIKEDNTINIDKVEVNQPEVEVKKGEHHHKDEEHKEVCPECGKEVCECDKKSLEEDAKIMLNDLGDFEPWSGAVDLWNEILKEDKLEELDFMLEDLFPDGLTITQLNDLLWFESDFVREQLGLVDVPEDEE